MSNFLPPDYEAPKGSSNYMKFEQGENKFRILSAPLLGWLDWKDKVPHRFPMNEKPKHSLTPGQTVKHFWAMAVWNYAEKAIQVLEVTQSTIQSAIADYSNDADWGSPFDYDFKVTKSGAGLETKYVIAPVPHKAMHPEIARLWNEKHVDLNALFTNDDPFDTNGAVKPPAAAKTHAPATAVQNNTVTLAHVQSTDDGDLPF